MGIRLGLVPLHGLDMRSMFCGLHLSSNGNGGKDLILRRKGWMENSTCCGYEKIGDLEAKRQILEPCHPKTLMRQNSNMHINTFKFNNRNNNNTAPSRLILILK